MKKLVILATFTFLMSINVLANEADKSSIDTVLNDFHQSASDANFEHYFAQLADGAVFLGTDATERWSKKEFAEFVRPYFSKGIGWTYRPTERHIDIIANGTTAYFDELLHSDSYGQCRGSGVLVLTEQGWKIMQYNLSFPIPNSIAKSLTKQIKTHQQDVKNNDK